MTTADSAAQVAVESAADASTSAAIADNAATDAQNAAAAVESVQTETTVAVAEAAVVLAQTEAALVTAEAAAIIRDAEATVTQIEGETEWHGEAIRTLQANQSEVQRQLENLTLAVRELVATPELVSQSDSLPSTPPNSDATTEATAETPPPTVEPETVAAIVENPPNAGAGGQKVAENQAARLAEKRKRVLHFL